MSTPTARHLRKHLTFAEGLLWKQLRIKQAGGNKFRRQHPLGPYIVDFVCLEKRLVIEVDGGQHNDKKVVHDQGRTAWLESRGYHVLRFWNHEIIEDMSAVKRSIGVALGLESASPPPQSSPSRGEEGLKKKELRKGHDI